MSTGNTILASDNDLARLQDEGGVALTGTVPHSYLGVPLKDASGDTVGVIAVQSYDCGITYSERELLEFTSQQTAMALQRRKAEDALRESEQMLASVFRHTPSAITVSGMEDATFLAVNDAFTLIIGYPREEAIGHTSAELGIFDDFADRARLLQHAREGTARDLEITFVARDGHRVAALVSGSILDIRGKPCVVTAVTDISARVQAERASRESQQRYRLLFNEMLNGFALHEVIIDESGGPVDFRYLEVNPAFERLTGLSAGEVVGKRMREILPDTEPEWLEVCARVALTGEPASFTSYHRQLKRHYDVSSFSTESGRFASIFADVSERKAMEEELRRERDLARGLLSVALVLVVVLDTQGNIVSMNPCAEATTGYRQEELLGVNWFTTLVPEASREVVLERFHRALAGEDVGGTPSAVTTKDGRETTVAWHTSVLAGGQGEPVGLLAIGYDLTEKRLLEEQLAQA